MQPWICARDKRCSHGSALGLSYLLVLVLVLGSRKYLVVPSFAQVYLSSLTEGAREPNHNK